MLAQAVYVVNFYVSTTKLPPTEFFKEYFIKFDKRFAYSLETSELLSPLKDNNYSINIPVNIDYNNKEHNDSQFAQLLLKDNYSLLLEGEPGSGKSTLCYRIAHQLVRHALDGTDEIIPILISLRESVPDEIFKAFKMSCEQLGVRVFENIYNKALPAAKVVILLDGLDEVNDLGEGIKNLIKLLGQKKFFSLVITTRPHILENVSSINDCMQKCKIVKLKESQIKKLATQYGVSVLNEIYSKQLDLSSPLQLLMYIKVKSEGLINDNMTIFNMYVNYLIVLTRYYNTFKDDSYINELLSVLADAANEVVQHTNNKHLSINELFDIFVNNNSNKYINDLVKCGVITSRNGKASFLHKSFEEFGIAYGIVKSIKTKDLTALGKFSPSSDNTYSVASSGLTENEVDILIEFLNASSNKVRKRVIGVLKYLGNYINDNAENRLVELLYREKSRKVIQSIFRIALRTENPEILIKLLIFNGIEKSKKIEFLKSVNNEDVVDKAVRFTNLKTTQCLDGNICYWLLIVLINMGRVIYYAEYIANILINDKYENKVKVFSLITSENNRYDCNELISFLYRHLKDPRDILNLYHKYLAYEHNLHPDDAYCIIQKLEKLETVSFSDFKRLKDIYFQSSLNEKYLEILKNIAKLFNYNLDFYNK